MTWPVTDVTTTNLDAGTDNPSLARVDLLLAAQNVNFIKNHVSAAAQTVLDDASTAAMLVTLGGEAVVNKDNTGGYVGLTLYKINFKNVANTFTSFFTNTNTAARTYTFPDKDLTVAGLVDITGGTSAGSFTALTSSGDVAVGKTITAPATTGAQTINKTAGSVNFAAAATSLVVTNSLVTANSVVIVTIAANDTTFTSAQVVQAAGSFTIYANAAATAETRVNFLVIN